MSWGALAARARGLTTHLRTAAAAPTLAALPLQTIADELVASGALPAGTAADAVTMDIAATRVAARRMATLARWGVVTDAPIDALVGALELDMIRILLRGAASLAPASWRLATLVPTPTLPRRLLERAARLERPEQVLALLVASGHFAGAPAVAAWQASQASQARATTAALCATEHALAVAWGARFASARARRAADAPLRAWLEDEAWLRTLWSVLAVSAAHLSSSEIDALLTPVPGAEQPPIDLRRVAHDGEEAIHAVLAPLAARHIGLTAALAATAGNAEHAARDAQRQYYAAWARRAPLSSAPVIHAVLAIAAECAAIRRLAFSHAGPSS